jgi:uncharacterized protein (TIGR00730 family)
MHQRPTPERDLTLTDQENNHPAGEEQPRLDPALADARGDRIDELIDEIKLSADKLAKDHASRGDLKLLSRTLRELRYAFKVFSPFRTFRKVTIFGSARTKPEHPTYLQAVEFGRQIARHRWMVVTGAAGGIMEAGLVGASREHSMGLNILLPFEQSANPVIAGDPKLVHMKYFFTRKLMFVKESDAICLLPGGFGTLDEGLEVLTLLQTGKRDLVPVVLLDEPGGDYWSTLQTFIDKQLLAKGLISPEDVHLYKRTDCVEEAVNEILQFFRVYHSMRFVHGKLVLRLNRHPSDAVLAEIQKQYADILASGRFEITGQLPQEKEETALADLPRLVFHYNRFNQGRLRQLIDFINRMP